MASINTEQRKKGKVHVVRWYDVHKKERQRTFRTKELAKDFVKHLVLESEGVVPVPSSGNEKSNMTFEVFSAIWYENHCKVHKSEACWIDDRLDIKNHLLPVFGTKKLSILNRLDIKTLQTALSKKGLVPKSVNKMTGLAHKIMRDCAEDWRWVRENPFAGYKRLKEPEPPFSFWTAEERDTFLEKCTELAPDFYDFFFLALHTGCRLGEIQALQGDALDFKRRVVIVRRKFYEKTRKTSEWLKMGKKPREIAMNSALLETMQKYRFVPDEKLVFERLKRSKYRKALDSVAKVAGVKRLKFHELRHTFASTLAMAGVPIIKIKDLMGHSSIQQTMRYAHLCPNAFSDATEALVTSQAPKSASSKTAEASL